MRRWFIAALLALCSVALNAQGLEVTTVANLPTCTDGSPWIVLVVDGASSTDCSTGSGSTEAVCTCRDGVIAGLSTSGGSSNSFETQNVDNGTDPVADSSTDTLNWTSGTGITITGDSSTDTITIASTIPDLTLDLGDDGGNDSTALAEIATIYDRYGIVTEPSADKALFDFAPVDDRYLSGPPASPATPDDEFNGSLAGSWTVVSGGSGTVDPHSNASAVEVYDLSTRSGLILIQVGNDTGDDVLFRQDYTVPDGSLVVAMFYPALTSGGNAAQCGIGLNDNDTAPTSGNTMEIILDAQAAGVRVLVQSTGATSGNGIADDSTGQVALAITRVDAGANKAYAGWASFNGGVTWAHVDTATHSATLDNLWLFCDTRSTHAAGQNDPVTAVDWLRGEPTTNLYSISF